MGALARHLDLLAQQLGQQGLGGERSVHEAATASSLRDCAHDQKLVIALAGQSTFTRACDERGALHQRLDPRLIAARANDF